MSTAEIILIIGTVTTAIISIITAIKVKAVQHLANGAVVTQADKIEAQAAKIDARDATIIALTKTLSDAQETAKLLAQRAGPVKRTK